MKKLILQNFKSIFPVILRTFELECHCRTSPKFTFVMCVLVEIWKIEKAPLRKQQM